MKDIVSIILFHKVDLSEMSEKTQKNLCTHISCINFVSRNIQSSVALHQPSRDATVVQKL